MVRTFEYIDQSTASRILATVYENDRGATFSGSWGDGLRYVSGPIVTAVARRSGWKRGKTDLWDVEVSAGALSSETSLNDYLPRDLWV